MAELECTLGVIIKNGVDVYEIHEGNNTQLFSGIFQIIFDHSYYGNGCYQVAVKQPSSGYYKIGMTIEPDWTIKSARIIYDWRSIWCEMNISDRNDHELCISVWNTSRPHSDNASIFFNSAEIVKSIVLKAKEIAKTYASVEIYNEIEKFKDAKQWLDSAPYEYMSEIEPPTPEEYLNTAIAYIDHFKDLVKVHNRVITLLDSSDDERSKILIEELTLQLNSLKLKKSLPLYK